MSSPMSSRGQRRAGDVAPYQVRVVWNVVGADVFADLALYAVHLPLDAHPRYGNNHELARYLGLKGLKSASHRLAAPPLQGQFLDGRRRKAGRPDTMVYCLWMRLPPLAGGFGEDVSPRRRSR